MVDQIFMLHRKKIDKIDSELMKLLESRFEIAKKLGEYKKKNGIKIVDIKREKEIINSRLKNSKLSKDFNKKLFNLIIKESRRVQK